MNQSGRGGRKRLPFLREAPGEREVRQRQVQIQKGKRKGAARASEWLAVD